MPVQTIAHSEPEKLFAEAANQFFSCLEKVTTPQVTVALPGGRSVVGLLKKMATLGGERSALWKRLHFFIVDERLVPLDHADSNYKLVNELFFSHAVAQGLIAQSQIHPFHFEPKLPDRGTAKYQAELEKFGGRFDAVVLGVGEDAHVGALFPRHHSISEKSNFFITMDDSPKPPPARMSASLALLRRSTIGFGLFIGEAKREAYQTFLDPTKQLSECPAKVLDELPKGFVVTDLVNQGV